MNVIGMGTALLECLRVRRLIERHGETFLMRVFTNREIRACQAARHTAEAFAARWAAKQAVLVSLSMGKPRTHLWTDLELRASPGGKVRVLLRGAVRDRAEQLQVRRLRVSLAYTRAYATATALALAGRRRHGPPPPSPEEKE